MAREPIYFVSGDEDLVQAAVCGRLATGWAYGCGNVLDRHACLSFGQFGLHPVPKTPA